MSSNLAVFLPQISNAQHPYTPTKASSTPRRTRSHSKISSLEKVTAHQIHMEIQRFQNNVRFEGQTSAVLQGGAAG